MSDGIRKVRRLGPDDRALLHMKVGASCYVAVNHGPVWEWTADGEGGKDRPRICCYDGAPFGSERRPLGLPVGRIMKQGRRTYRCVLTFCGWGCVRAYNKYEFSPRDRIGTDRRDALIVDMYVETARLNGELRRQSDPRTPPEIRELFGDDDGPPARLTDRRLITMRVPTAPPRQVLLTGAMTLDVFRADGEPVLWEARLPPSIGVQLLVEGYRNKVVELSLIHI